MTTWQAEKAAGVHGQFGELRKGPNSPVLVTHSSHPIAASRVTLDLTALRTSDRAMRETLASGRTSDTPDAPIEVCLSDTEGVYEIVDGHHRVAQAILRGAISVEAVVYDYVDDEPYEPPYYDFRVPDSFST